MVSCSKLVAVKKSKNDFAMSKVQSRFIFTEISFPCKTGTTAKTTPLAGNLLLNI